MGSRKQTMFPGDRHLNRSGTWVVVIDYVNSKKVKVKFDDEYAYEDYYVAADIRTGRVRSPYDKTVYGIGFIGEGRHKTSINGVQTFAYKKWSQMFGRCYSETERSVLYYSECCVEKIWHNFQNFGDWCESQKGFGEDTWHLDKDLISPGSKVYGPDHCCFVPQRVNKILLKREASRTTLPIGIQKRPDCARYTVQSYDKDSNRLYLGCFETINEAFSVYKSQRLSVIRDIASEYVGLVDPRVYKTLMEYQIDIGT